MKVYITKYALTEGIIEKDDAEECHIPTMISVPSMGHQACFHGAEWHCTLDEAVEQAEKMRILKIKSLHKSLAKMEKLNFATKLKTEVKA